MRLLRTPAQHPGDSPPQPDQHHPATPTEKSREPGQSLAADRTPRTERQVFQMDIDTTNSTAAGPVVACDQCTGRPIYRVQLEDFRAAADNFEQLVDHRPALFTNQQWLARVAKLEHTGKVTVWRLADADQGGEFALDVVIAYAGPVPGRPTERDWLTDLSGHGFYDELVDSGWVR